MDEYLFISMAKLGADRLKDERARQAAAPVAAVRPTQAASPKPSGVENLPTTAAVRLASFSLAFALVLAAIGVGVGIAVSPEPAGEVSVTALDANGNVPDEVRVAEREAGVSNAR